MAWGTALGEPQRMYRQVFGGERLSDLNAAVTAAGSPRGDDRIGTADRVGNTSSLSGPIGSG